MSLEKVQPEAENAKIATMTLKMHRVRLIIIAHLRQTEGLL
jgi:hypothetical protein